MNGEIIRLIQAVGFPIAAYLLLYFDLRSRIFKELDYMKNSLADMRTRLERIEDVIDGS